MKRKSVDQPDAIEQSVVLTWNQLVAREPRLQALLDEISAVRDNPQESYFCPHEYWYFSARGPGFVAQLDELVGWHCASSDALLSSSEAYDCAYRELHSALPDCRACSCLSLEVMRAHFQTPQRTSPSRSTPPAP